MNQLESIQRQLAEIQEQLDQCATKEDIKEFKDTISKEKYYIPSTKISADELEQILNKSRKRFKAAMCDVNLETKIEGELYADPIQFNALVAASIKNKQAFRKEANEKLKQSLANSVLKQGEQNLKQIQEQEFKPEEQSSFREVFEYMKTDSKQHNDAIVGSHIAGSVKEGDIRRDGIITRLTAELQQQGTAIARSIHVEAFVDMFIHLAECKVPAGQEYKYAEHQARKMIEFIGHTLRK